MNMQLMETIYKRKSIRVFEPGKISDEDITQIIESGTLAPSAKNRQPWYFYILKDSEINILLQNMLKAVDNLSQKYKSRNISRPDIEGAYQTFNSMKHASAVIFVTCRKKYKKHFDDGVKWYLHALDIEVADILSIGAAIEHMLLKATEMGYGTLWVCDIFYAYPQIVDFFQTDDAIVSAICIGHPGEFPSNRSRLLVKDVSIFYHTEE